MALSDREHELLAQLSPDKSVSAEALAGSCTSAFPRYGATWRRWPDAD